MKRVTIATQEGTKMVPCYTMHAASEWRVQARDRARKFIKQHKFRLALEASREPRCEWPEGPEAEFIHMLADVASDQLTFEGTSTAAVWAQWGVKKKVWKAEEWKGPN